MDEQLRRLERLAATGDPEAVERLQHLQARLGASRFYCYHQNNPNGVMLHNKVTGLGALVTIEALNDDAADDRLRSLVGSSYYDHCECCGHRWGNPEIYDSLDELLEFLTNPELRSYYSNRSDQCYIHFLDGRIASC